MHPEEQSGGAHPVGVGGGGGGGLVGVAKKKHIGGIIGWEGEKLDVV